MGLPLQLEVRSRHGLCIFKKKLLKPYRCFFFYFGFLHIHTTDLKTKKSFFSPQSFLFFSPHVILKPIITLLAFFVTSLETDILLLLETTFPQSVDQSQSSQWSAMLGCGSMKGRALFSVQGQILGWQTEAALFVCCWLGTIYLHETCILIQILQDELSWGEVELLQVPGLVFELLDGYLWT